MKQTRQCCKITRWNEQDNVARLQKMKQTRLRFQITHEIDQCNSVRSQKMKRTSLVRFLCGLHSLVSFFMWPGNIVLSVSYVAWQHTFENLRVSFFVFFKSVYERGTPAFTETTSYTSRKPENGWILRNFKSWWDWGPINQHWWWSGNCMT